MSIVIGIANHVWKEAGGIKCLSWYAILICLLKYYHNVSPFLNRHNEHHHQAEMILMEKYLHISHDMSFMTWFYNESMPSRDHIYFKNIIKSTVEARYIKTVLSSEILSGYAKFSRYRLMLDYIQVRLHLLECISKMDVLFSIMRERLKDIEIFLARQTFNIPKIFIEMLQEHGLYSALIPMQIPRASSFTISTAKKLSLDLWLLSHNSNKNDTHSKNLQITFGKMTKKISTVSKYLKGMKHLVKEQSILKHQDFLPTVISSSYQLLSLEHFLAKTNSFDSKKIKKYKLLVRCQTLLRALYENSLSRARQLHERKILIKELPTQFRIHSFSSRKYYNSMIRIYSVESNPDISPKHTCFLKRIDRRTFSFNLFISDNYEDFYFLVLRCIKLIQKYDGHGVVSADIFKNDLYSAA